MRGDGLRSQVPRDRPQNEPSADVFGHIQNRPSAHANAGCHLDSRAAYDLRSCLYGPAADARAAHDDAAGELTPVVGAGVGDFWGRTMLSVDQFLRLISVPAVLLAFHIAAQVTGG